MDDDKNLPLPATENKEKLISSFIESTSPSRETAISFLETHRWDLDAAVSAFTGNNVVNAEAAESNGILAARTIPSNLRINIPVSSHSPSRGSSDHIPSRLRSRSPPPLSRARYALFSNQEIARKIYELLGLSGGTDSDSDQAREYYDGGEQSETIVQDPKKDEDVDDEAKESDEERPIQTTFRIITPEPQVVFEYIVTIWRNGFTLDDGPLNTMDDPEDAHFLEVVERLESPRDLNPQDTELRVRIKLIRRQEEDFNDSPFPGVGRTLSGSTPPASSDSLTTTTQPPSMDLVVDPAAPITSIQLRLADGTRIVSRFNTHLTVRDVRNFIDASRPGGSRDYQLLIMGSPPKPVLDFDQTIDKAGISNSVLIQKY